MSEATGCSGSCASCPSKGNCGKPQSLLEPANSLSDIKKVIAVVSGKGGVGPGRGRHRPVHPEDLRRHRPRAGHRAGH